MTPGQCARMGLQLDSELGQWRNFQLLLRGVSMSERDLEGGNAAELEVGVETAPGLAQISPSVPPPSTLAWSPGRVNGSSPLCFLSGAPGLSSLLSYPRVPP